METTVFQNAEVLEHTTFQDTSPADDKCPTVGEAWTQPRCLVELSDDGLLTVNKETLTELNAIADPLVVVSVVGPYRTGKSYLMNRLAGTYKGFSVGSTVQAHTKGIWIWCRPHPKRDNCCLLLIDTEGLADSQKANNTNDTAIFTLTILLSSMLVYNCKNAVDKHALDALHFVTVASEHIKIKGNAGGQEGLEEEENEVGLDKYFPEFVVSVRDFTLELAWEGKPITEDEYLEGILTLRKGKTRNVVEYNLPRECIRTFFQTRKCFLFPRPVTDDKQLQYLDELPEDKMNEEFLNKVDKFTDYIYTHSEPKKVDINPVNGRSFASLTQCYVEAMAKGSICIESAVESMAKAENQKLAAEALDIYQKKFGLLVQFPTDLPEMIGAHDVCEKQATEYFFKHCMCDHDGSYKAQFQRQVHQAYDELQSQNKKASVQRCEELIKDMNTLLTKTNYMEAGGYERYRADINELKTKYDSEKGKGIMASAMWTEFLEQQKNIGSSILNADESISKASKKAEMEKRNREDAERRVEAANEKLKQREEMLGYENQWLKHQIESMQQQMDVEKRQRDEKSLARVQAQLAEYERLQSEGLTDKANQQMENIKALQQEIAKRSEEDEKRMKALEKMMQQQSEKFQLAITKFTEAVTKLTMENKQVEKNDGFWSFLKSIVDAFE